MIISTSLCNQFCFLVPFISQMNPGLWCHRLPFPTATCTPSTRQSNSTMTSATMSNFVTNFVFLFLLSHRWIPDSGVIACRFRRLRALHRPGRATRRWPAPQCPELPTITPPSRPPHLPRWTLSDNSTPPGPPRSHLRPGPRVGPATSCIQQRTTSLPSGSFNAIPATPSDRLRWVPIVRRQPFILQLRIPDRWHGWSFGHAGPRSSHYRGVDHGIACLSDLRSVSYLHQESFAMSVSTRYEHLDEDRVVKSVMSNSLTLSLLFIILAISVTLWRTMTEELYWCVVLWNYKCI